MTADGVDAIRSHSATTGQSPCELSRGLSEQLNDRFTATSLDRSLAQVGHFLPDATGCYRGRQIRYRWDFGSAAIVGQRSLKG